MMFIILIVNNLLVTFENTICLCAGVICYDDACHLKKFAQNPVRSDLTEIAKRLKGMKMVCDKFHFRNHVDSWCKVNCNPYSTTDLEVIFFKVLAIYILLFEYL